MPIMRRSRLLWVVLALVVVAGGVALMLRPWESNAQTKFAEDRAGPNTSVPFDKKRAMGYLKQICDLGPRVTGSELMHKQQELLKKHFEDHGAKVELQRFEAKQRSLSDKTAMANLIARWHPDRTRRIMLCTHYDTRPIADREPNPDHWKLPKQPFLGANDGGSGAALMMELAHHLAAIET
jgi:hypothetical protein